MTVTTDIDFLIVEENQNSKEVVVNDNMVLLDKNLAATLDVVTTAGGTISITRLQFQENARLRLTGTPAAAFIIETTSIKGFMVISNRSGQTATVRSTATPGTTVSVADNEDKLIYNTGSVGNNTINLSGSAAAASSLVDWKDSVRAATTANITLSGTQTVDGVALIATNRCLVKDQTTGSQNGMYVVAAGAWTRATDADVNAEVTSGLAVVVNEGTINGDKIFILTTNDPIVVGTTSLTFAAISAGGGGGGSGGGVIPFSGALVAKTATQLNLTALTWTAVSFNTETYDDDNFHDNVTNNTRLTVPSGVTKVRLKASIESDASGTTSVALRITKNGALVPGSPLLQTGDGFSNDGLNISSPVLVVTPGDYFELEILFLGSNRDVLATNQTWFSIEAVEGTGGNAFSWASELASTFSASLFATKGAIETPFVDIKVSQVAMYISAVTGHTYKAYIMALNSSNVVQSIIASSAFVATATGAQVISLPVVTTMIAGTKYFIALGRTDGTNTFALLSSFTTPATDVAAFPAFPFTPYVDTTQSTFGRVAKAVPAVSDTILIGANAFAVGLLGSF